MHRIPILTILISRQLQNLKGVNYILPKIKKKKIFPKSKNTQPYKL